MTETIEAIVDAEGNLRPLTRLDLREGQHVHITVAPKAVTSLSATKELAAASEAALAVDWNREEEDQAWAHLQ